VVNESEDAGAPAVVPAGGRTIVDLLSVDDELDLPVVRLVIESSPVEL
jgi:hypothetical protein